MYLNLNFKFPQDCDIKEERTLKPDGVYSYAFALKTHHFRVHFAAPTRSNQLDWIKQIRKSRSKVSAGGPLGMLDDDTALFIVRLGWIWIHFESQEDVSSSLSLQRMKDGSEPRESDTSSMYKFFCVLQDDHLHWYKVSRMRIDMSAVPIIPITRENNSKGLLIALLSFSSRV